MKQYIFLGMAFYLFVACSAKTSTRFPVTRSVDREDIIASKEDLTTQKSRIVPEDSVSLTDSTLSINKKIYKLNEAYRKDKEWVNTILSDAATYNKQHEIGEVILFIAGKFIGKPYVAH